MSDPFVDTHVIIRLLTGDDPVVQARAASLFSRVEAGALDVAAPDTVIADAVFVLSSPRLYRLTRAVIRDLLSALVRLPGFHVQNRQSVLDALRLYGASNLDFGDAMIAAAMQRVGERTLYSYDRRFDRLGGVERREP